MRLLLPLPTDRLPLRWAMLCGGLVAYGASSGLILQADLGADPWDVLHQGLARTFGGQIGTWAIAVSLVVLLLWFPLRERFGVGTLANAVVVGLCINVTLRVVPAQRHVALQAIMLVTGIVLNGLATGLYIGAGFGPGPRDGLTTAFAARGYQIRLIRTAVEVTVLAIGWALGGSVGVGTVMYAVSIGPLTHRTLPLFRPKRNAQRSDAKNTARAASAGPDRRSVKPVGDVVEKPDKASSVDPAEACPSIR
jgi:uncharacterized membrane protein YczE